MIQTPEGVDRGQALYKMYPGAITDLVMSRKKQALGSSKHKALRNLCSSIDLYIDNKNPVSNPAISDMSPQLIRRGYQEYVALFYKFLETDPLFSGKNNDAGVDSAITELLTKNIEKTYYRERCLHWTIDQIVRYGTAVTYTFGVNDYEAGGLMTIKDPDAHGSDTYSQVVNKGTFAAVSTPVHPLNTIVDPNANYMQAPDYIGVLTDITISGLHRLMDNPVYIPENIKKVLQLCKDGMKDNDWYNGESRDKKDYSRGHSVLTNIWTKLQIDGNESDDTVYAIEMINDTIIRIEQSPLDGGVSPVSISRVNARPYDWFGGSVLLDKVAMQNLQYWLMNTTVEGVARANDRITLYHGGKLPVDEMENRHRTNGYVAYYGQEQDLSKLMFSPQQYQTPIQENEWLMQLTRREDQDTSAIPNFNPQSEGGPTNKTLGGAQMMASIGELKMSRHITDMSIGLKDVAKHQLAILINLMPDSIPEKMALIANKNVVVKTSNVFNYMREAVDAKNRLTDAINFVSTGGPEFSGLKIAKYVEDWVRNSIKKEDIGEYFEEVQQPPPQQQMPGQPMPAPQGQMPIPQGGVM
jgi:hypothetical protein